MHEQGYRPAPPHTPTRTGRRASKTASQARRAPNAAPRPQYAPQSQQSAPHAPMYSADPRMQGYTPVSPMGGKPARKKSGLGRFLVILVVLALLAGGGYYGKTHMDVSAYDNVFCNNVYVDGIHLGGMTAQQAYDAVQAQATQRESSWYVRLMYGQQVVATITADALGMRTQVKEVLQNAWQLGHTGSIFDRQQAMQQLSVQPYEAYTTIPSADTSVIDQLLSTIQKDVYKAPQDAALLAFNTASPSDPFVYQYEVIGRTLDIEPLKNTLYTMVSRMESGDLEVVPTPIQPNVTVADLQKQHTLIADITTKISSSSTENRTNNVRRACELISGTIIKPGDKFSFNTVVGPRSYKNGFFDAVEYAYSQEIMGVGGGVCQVSSTLYLAALRSGMTIVKREPHSMEVSYTVYGQDATVNYDGKKIDFVFRNSAEGPVYITAEVEEKGSKKKSYSCRVRIFGPSLGENTFYDIESITTEILKPSEEIVYVPDKELQYVTYTDQTKKISGAKEGYVVETYRSKVVDGVEVERELISTDTYKARQARYWIGTIERATN